MDKGCHWGLELGQLTTEAQDLTAVLQGTIHNTPAHRHMGTHGHSLRPPQDLP